MNSHDALSNSGFSGFLLEALARVANTLLLVRVGLSEAANSGCRLPDQLLVRTGDDDMGILVDLYVDPFGNRKFDGMRIAELEFFRNMNLPYFQNSSPAFRAESASAFTRP